MDNEMRARALLQKMTLEEKIGQLSMLAVYRLDEQGVPECERLQEALEKGLVGAVIQGMHDFKDAIYQMQKTIVEKSRLKIPLLFNVDLIHGFDTVMPIPLAASCSFDPELVEEATKATAIEATSCGVHYTNAPMLDIARVSLKSGKKKRVCFEITQDKLSYYHEDRSYGADDGVFDVFIGANSNANLCRSFALITK